MNQNNGINNEIINIVIKTEEKTKPIYCLEKAVVETVKIYEDFKDKFIRAEIVFWSDLLGAGSYPSAKAQGLVRTEGKEYIVKDGDVIEFKV